MPPPDSQKAVLHCTCSKLCLAYLQVTQLGQVKDLATAFHKILGNSKAKNQIYNISGARFVTFDGIAKACAKAAGAPEPELIHYNPKDFDFGGKKAFPLRDQHFFASIDKVCKFKLKMNQDLHKTLLFQTLHLVACMTKHCDIQLTGHVNSRFAPHDADHICAGYGGPGLGPRVQFG